MLPVYQIFGLNLSFSELVILLILLIIGILVIVVVVKIIAFILPAGIIAIVVYFLTNSLFWAGIAFLAVAFLSVLRRR